MDPATQYLVGQGMQAGTQVGGMIASGIQGRMNRQFQTDVNKKNEALMRESWGREDTAVQRRTKDLRAAGINPLLAAGQAAQSGSPIKLDPLKASEVSQHFSGLGESLKGMAYSKVQGAQTAQSLAQGEKQLGILDAQKDYIESQTRLNDANTNRTGVMTPLDATMQELNIELKKLQNPLTVQHLEESIKHLGEQRVSTQLNNTLTEWKNKAAEIGVSQDEFNLMRAQAIEETDKILRTFKVPTAVFDLLRNAQTVLLIASQIGANDRSNRPGTTTTSRDPDNRTTTTTQTRQPTEIESFLTAVKNYREQFNILDPKTWVNLQ